MFQAQDVFIKENPPVDLPEEPEAFCDARHSAVAHLDEHCEEFPHVCNEPVSRFQCMVNELTLMPNRLQRMFPSADALKPCFGWASDEKIQTMLGKTTQHCRGAVHFSETFQVETPCSKCTKTQ